MRKNHTRKRISGPLLICSPIFKFLVHSFPDRGSKKLIKERKLTCFRGLLKMEACSFWLMLLSLLLLLLSPLLAFLLLSLFFISWFVSVRSPLFAFPGLPCAVRPLELCPPVLVFLSSLYSLSFVFVCPLFTFLFSGFFPPLFVFSLFSVIFLSFRKKPPCSFSPPLVFSFFSPVSPPSSALVPPLLWSFL